MTMPVEIIDRLRDAVTPVAKEGEHREEPRMVVGTSVSVTVSPTDAYSSVSTLKMRVADFSGSGVGLLTGSSLPIGSEVLVSLPKPSSGNYELRCAVCNCRAVADGVYRIGVRFEGIAA